MQYSTNAFFSVYYHQFFLNKELSKPYNCVCFAARNFPLPDRLCISNNKRFSRRNTLANVSRHKLSVIYCLYNTELSFYNFCKKFTAISYLRYDKFDCRFTIKLFKNKTEVTVPKIIVRHQRLLFFINKMQCHL